MFYFYRLTICQTSSRPHEWWIVVCYCFWKFLRVEGLRKPRKITILSTVECGKVILWCVKQSTWKKHWARLWIGFASIRCRTDSEGQKLKSHISKQAFFSQTWRCWYKIIQLSQHETLFRTGQCGPFNLKETPKSRDIWSNQNIYTIRRKRAKACQTAATNQRVTFGVEEDRSNYRSSNF